MSERSLHLGGWALFIVSALFFIAADWRAGNPIGVFGGLFFLLGCIAFLVPMLRPNQIGRSERTPRDRS